MMGTTAPAPRTRAAAPPDAPAPDEAAALAGRLFEGAYAFLDLLAVYVGDRLGCYRALASGGALTAGELAERTGMAPRYAREWVEQQAVTGLLDVDDPDAPAELRRYALPAGAVAVLVDLDSPFSMTPLARGLVASANAMPALLEAYRSGGGVPWGAFGPDLYEAQGDFNRPWLQAQLGTAILPSIPDVHRRLQADPPAQVADVGCGAGWAAIAVAQAYPRVVVRGFDTDEASIALARRNAVAAGVADRVTFEVADLTDGSVDGRYDLVLEVEVIHDLARPVEALATMRRILAPGGAVLAVEEAVADRFTIGHPVDRFMYGFSLVGCLPVAMAEQPSAAVGTVLRQPAFRDLARQAGFADVAVVDTDRPLQRLYRLVP